MYDSIDLGSVAVVRLADRARTSRTCARRRRRAAAGDGASGRRAASSRAAARASRGQLGVPPRRSPSRSTSCAERVVVRVGVLAHVQRREVQAEGRRGCASPAPAGRGRRAAPRCVDAASRAPARSSVEQLAGAGVVAPGLVRAAGGEPPARVHELLLDAGELQPVRLLGVEAAEARLHLGQQLQVARERLAQLRRDAGDPLRARQVARAARRPRAIASRSAWSCCRPSTSARRCGRHVRVAVAVAADPACRTERPPRPARQLEPEPRELVGQLLQHVGHGVGVQLVEVVDRVARLVHRRRAARSAARRSATAGR